MIWIRLNKLFIGKEQILNETKHPPDDKTEPDISRYTRVLDAVLEELRQYHPRAVLLFGSLARWMKLGRTDHFPNDIDLLIISNSSLFGIEKKDFGICVEFNRLTVDQMVSIAKSLRYDTKVTALSKLYSKNVVKQHSIDVIAAACLLGSGYNDFGIEQIEIEGRIDTRDYSIHEVLMGKTWWDRLRKYALERRGPWKRFSDRIVQNEDFIP